jgi:hypothetical protein
MNRLTMGGYHLASISTCTSVLYSAVIVSGQHVAEHGRFLLAPWLARSGLDGPRG